jgi:hypothetical protein
MSQRTLTGNAMERLRRMREMKGAIRIVGAALVVAGVLLAAPALAQEEAGPVAPDEEIEGTGVGISGGILLGAELVLAIEAIVGVEQVWPWVVFPILGAGGGGVGGYFVETASPEAAVAMLVCGMVFVIPTAVAISASTAYDPEAEGAVDDASGGAAYSFELTPEDEPPLEGTTTEVEKPEGAPEGDTTVPPESAAPPEPETPAPEPPSPEQQRLRHLSSGSLLHLSSDLDAGFGVPAIDVRPAASSGEEAMYGLDRGVRVHVPLLKIDLP